MTDTGTPATSGLFARVIGVILSPTATFRAVVADPRPAGVLFLACLALAIATAVPFMTESGQRAMAEMQVENMERFTGQPVTPEARAQMQQNMRIGGVFGAVGVFVFVPVITLLMTGLFWALFNILFGGSATFKQVLAVMTHSQVIGALGALIGLPLMLMSGTFSQAGPFNLGALAFGLAPDHPLALLLSNLTIFSVWQSVVTGLGLAVLYGRKPGGIITIILIATILITALLTVGPQLMFGR
jgi:hypothetical protein